MALNETLRPALFPPHKTTLEKSKQFCLFTLEHPMTMSNVVQPGSRIPAFLPCQKRNFYKKKGGAWLFLHKRQLLKVF